MNTDSAGRTPVSLRFALASCPREIQDSQQGAQFPGQERGRLCSRASLFQKSFSGGLMRSEQPFFDRLGQVSDFHCPPAPVTNIAVMLDERMLARVDNARGFGIGPQVLTLTIGATPARVGGSLIISQR